MRTVTVNWHAERRLPAGYASATAVSPLLDSHQRASLPIACLYCALEGEIFASTWSPDADPVTPCRWHAGLTDTITQHENSGFQCSRQSPTALAAGITHRPLKSTRWRSVLHCGRNALVRDRVGVHGHAEGRR